MGPGQFVEMRDPKKLSWGAQKEIATALSDESVGSQMGVAEKLFLALVKDGYLLDMDDKPVVFPITDPEIVSTLPSVVVEEVTKRYAEYRTSVAGKN